MRDKDQEAESCGRHFTSREERDHHHDRKESERSAAGVLGNNWKDQ